VQIQHPGQQACVGAAGGVRPLPQGDVERRAEVGAVGDRGEGRRQRLFGLVGGEGDRSGEGQARAHPRGERGDGLGELVLEQCGAGDGATALPDAGRGDGDGDTGEGAGYGRDEPPGKCAGRRRPSREPREIECGTPRRAARNADDARAGEHAGVHRGGDRSSRQDAAEAHEPRGDEKRHHASSPGSNRP
jgi:hypothetical protein